MTAGTSRHPREPNTFEFGAYSTRITYATTSISGQPLLHVENGGQTRDFAGAEIRRAVTEIGSLVSVTLESIPDLHVVTMTLVVPAVNLHDDEAPFNTHAIFTTHRTSIGGPALVQGPLHTYEVRAFRGVARFLVY